MSPGPSPKYRSAYCAATRRSSGSLFPAASSAATGFTRPWPRESSRPPFGESSAVSSSSRLTWEGVSSGYSDFSSAAAPDTHAAAALVPQPS